MKIIHIAGTNAKGSVVYYLESILKQTEWRSGVFTSPHLFSPRERIRVDGKPIPKETYDDLMPSQPRDRHRFFDWWEIAKAYFDQCGIEVAVVEAGIGGAKDITNEVRSEIAVLTRIGLDHTAVLGNTVEEIACEKCGIIKPNSLCVTLPQRESVMRLIERHALSQHASLVVAQPDRVCRSDAQTQVFELSGEEYTICSMDIRQTENAAAACLCAKHLGIDAQRIRKGLLQTRIPGRMQRIGGNIVADGAHNPQAVCGALERIRAAFPQSRLMVVTGVMKDKDAAGIARCIEAAADRVFCVCPDAARGLPSEQYAKYFQNARAYASPAEALLEARKEKRAVVAVLGSFYLLPKLFSPRELLPEQP